VQDPVELMLELLEELPRVMQIAVDSPFFPFVLYTANAIAVAMLGDINVFDPVDNRKKAITLQISELSRMAFGAWLLKQTQSEVGEATAMLIMGFSPLSNEIIDFILEQDVNTTIGVTGGFLAGGVTGAIVGSWWAHRTNMGANLEALIKRENGDYATKVVQAAYVIDNKVGLMVRNQMVNAGIIQRETG